MNRVLVTTKTIKQPTTQHAHVTVIVLATVTAIATQKNAASSA